MKHVGVASKHIRERRLDVIDRAFGVMFAEPPSYTVIPQDDWEIQFLVEDSSSGALICIGSATWGGGKLRGAIEALAGHEALKTSTRVWFRYRLPNTIGVQS